ncbi:MAG: sensor histidine kinase [Jatrophihabitans sp.]|uniref:sensor histidine kinase n=1 Tax=Jatrophihabitans sp. TaxID=1932789 RepID=UPI003F7EC3F2
MAPTGTVAPPARPQVEFGGAGRSARALRSIVEAQRAVHGARTRDEVTRLVAEHAVTAFPHADGSVVELVDGDRLVYTGVAGTLADAGGATVGVEGSLSGLAMGSRRTLMCHDTETDDRVDRAACRRLGIRSMAVVPLLSGDDAMGVLKISSAHPAAFDDVDAAHLELLGESLRQGLQHADDYERTEQLLADRTRAVAALEVSEQRFRRAFSNSPFGMLLIDVTEEGLGRLLHVNQAAADITGYSQQELLGMRQQQLRAPEHTAEVEHGMRRLAGGEVDSLGAERVFRHADGHDYWVRVQASGLPDTSGRITSLLAEIEDITTARAAERQLADQARLLQLIPAAVIVRGLDGVISWWNAAATELYGTPAEQAVGRVTHELLHTVFPDVASGAEQDERIARTGGWTGELQHRTADGRTIVVESRQVLHPGVDGRPDVVLEINTDITARRAAERERDAAAAELARRNDELEAANQLKLDLIGMLGHEIGTPLSVIHGSSELGADDDGPAGGLPEVQALFTAIERNARRLGAVVGEVLALVTLEAGMLVARPQRVPVGRHLADALELTESAPVVETLDGVTALVQPGHLDQILVNLLTNAAKYGGGCTRVVVDRADGEVTVAVHDEGPGVPEEFRARLFDRFSRAADTARVRTGTGLGLYIVQQLARANGGDVTHAPGPRGGSVFTVHLRR